MDWTGELAFMFEHHVNTGTSRESRVDVQLPSLDVLSADTNWSVLISSGGKQHCSHEVIVGERTIKELPASEQVRNRPCAGSEDVDWP